MIKYLLNLFFQSTNQSFEDQLIDDISAILHSYFKDISRFKLETLVKEWINTSIKPDILDSINTIESKIYKDGCVKYVILVIIIKDNSVITLRSNIKQVNINNLDKQILEQLEETSECILSFK